MGTEVVKSILTHDYSIINYNMGKEWKLLETTFILFPIYAYSPNTIGAENTPLKSPFDNQFFLANDNQLLNLPFK